MHDLDGNRLAEYEVDLFTGTVSLLQEYIWFDGVPVAVVDGATGAVYSVRTDQIGRPIFATDDTGLKVWEASYLPFGGLHVETGTAINLRFPGQWFHASNGLLQNWMRDYDPTLGRYIQADPLGLDAGENLFGYALQNPSKYIDPDGRNPLVGGAIRAVTAIGKKMLKRSPVQKRALPRHRGDRQIETPKKIRGRWHCKCRTNYNEEGENCPIGQKTV